MTDERRRTARPPLHPEAIPRGPRPRQSRAVPRGPVRRLTQVVDSATSTTEVYTWNNDGTLASYPGSGYTRLLDYDEEQRLVRIRKDHGGGNIEVAYEYGYGFDGARRWRQDIANQVWTRYPCAVASCAGDLVEQQSDLNGNTWTTTALYLRGSGLVRRNAEFHHRDLAGNVGVVTNGSAAVLSSNLYDRFGVQRFAQGAAATQWRPAVGQVDAEGLVVAGASYQLAARGLGLLADPTPKPKPGPAPLPNSCKETGWTPCTPGERDDCRYRCAAMGSNVVIYLCCHAHGQRDRNPICLCKIVAPPIVVVAL